MDDRDEAPDPELAARASTGDTAAFGALVMRHHPAAIRLATIVSGSIDDAPDIVQEACVKAYRALRAQPAPDAVRSWLLRIVANEAHNMRRGRDRRLRRDDRFSSMSAVAAGDTMDVALASVESGTLLRALSRLPVRDRTILAYRYFAGLSEAETAQATDTAVGTVKSRTARALARLRVELRATGGVEEVPR